MTSHPPLLEGQRVLDAFLMLPDATGDATSYEATYMDGSWWVMSLATLSTWRASPGASGGYRFEQTAAGVDLP